MRHQLETPFESIENAQEYLKLLLETVEEAKRDINDQLMIATDQMTNRRVQALRMVQFKLEKLQQHLTVSSRSLNDLRTLRRLLLEERRGTNFTSSALAA